MLDKEKILGNVKEEAKDFIAKALIHAEEVINTRKTILTKFADETVILEAKEILNYIPEIDSRPFGGFRGAKRARLSIFSSSFTDDSFDPHISYFQLETSDEPLSADEVVIGLRKASVLKEDIGDIFLTASSGWQGIIASETTNSLEDKDFEINGSLCKVVLLDQADVNFPNQSVREIKATVASLRIDAVAGSGFGASRTRMAEEIKAGRLKVNGKVTGSASASIKEGDVIVAKGRGRIVVDEVRGETKKGRIALLLKRYTLN